MTKAIALLALSLSLEAAFLFQIAVIARPQPRAAATPTVIAEVVTEADGETVAQSSAPAMPRS
jgi:hypothetical protein